jgi:hypothetical protein
MDDELLKQIRESTQKRANIRELDAAACAAALRVIENKLIDSTRRSTWWWESLRVPHKARAYEEDRAVAEIEQLIGNRSEMVWLVVTDDQRPPWPIFHGPLGEILGVIGDQRFFEYFLVSPTFPNPDWVIFDTHHNEFVVAGNFSRT